MGMAVVENAVIGLIGTLAGIAGGYAGPSSIVAGFGQVTPELLVEPTLSPATVLSTLALGGLVVATAPLFGVRRERRKDVAAARRVVE
jgi:putative ABC transport system permease protein